MPKLIVAKTLEIIAMTEPSKALKIVDGKWIPTSNVEDRTYNPPGTDHRYVLRESNVCSNGKVVYWWSCDQCRFKFGTSDRRLSWDKVTDLTCDEHITQRILDDLLC